MIINLNVCLRSIKYDYEIGRFTSVDPLWEKYTGWTGYQYTRNNSISRIDYNGMDDGQFGSWMQVGPIQELILGDKNVNTYQETIENSDKPVNKQLINAWAEIGLMGLTGVATDVALSSPFAAKYLSTASNYIKGLLGFGDDAVKGEMNLTNSQLKAISSLEKRISEHKIKLNEYIKDPLKFDNKGFLKNAPNDEIRQKIIQKRIVHLEQEIETFKNNIQIIKQGN